ncbi:MAG TPA: 23S rRNA (adenine(2503)-C(2))-methyltransferase RlmN, partial [Steroidobacteraceae bacterium]|nr:23S rRNA (adenine(2503)-C(2))-methyltransferase RlmN [Steroidobacteraceae bacterium]
MTTAVAKTNLLGLTRAELDAFVVGLGEKPFRARQLYKWLFKRFESDFDKMTDLAKSFRQKLSEVAEVRTPRIKLSQVSADGTRKWLLFMDGADDAVDLNAIDSRQCIEMVYIPEPGRGTLCISSQLGCAMDCTFCSTGQQGFNRNLTTAEIVGQVWLANRELRALSVPPVDESLARDEVDAALPTAYSLQPMTSMDGGNAGLVGNKARPASRLITNIVFMGMGEPLANFDALVQAIELLTAEWGVGISARRITVSTVGL